MHLFFNKKFALLFAWLLLIVVMLLTPMPPSSGPEEVTFVDKIVHAFLFGILAFVIFYWVKEREEDLVINPKRSVEEKIEKKIIKNKYIQTNNLSSIFLFTFFISTSISIALEYAQVYVPGRSSSVYDLLAGVIGIILVLIFIYGDNYSKKET